MTQLIPASQIVRRDQRFRCDVYSCAITAATCVDRQAMRTRLAMHSTLVARYMGCAACAVGQEIAARVPASPRIVGQNDQRRRVSRAELQRLHAIAG